MKRILVALLVFGLIGGLALADDVDVGEKSASVTQDITVIIPLRAALHITETEWNLDLDDDEVIGEYCWFISKNEFAENPSLSTALETQLLSIADKYELAVDFGYPPIRPDTYPITDDDKGYLVCLFEKVVQKFSNSGEGFEVEFRLAGAPDGGFGVFAFQDIIPAMPDQSRIGGSTSVADGSILDDFTVTGTSGGWLDDYITEGFFFDGSEVAGTYNLEFIVTLTNL